MARERIGAAAPAGLRVIPYNAGRGLGAIPRPPSFIPSDLSRACFGASSFGWRRCPGTASSRCLTETESSSMSFDSLGLPVALFRAVADAGYTEATAVQAAAIPPALQGADLRVSAATGSGKTASFVLPALSRVLAARGDASKRREKGVVHGPRVLVLAPTRELAMQVANATVSYGRHIPGLRVATIVGGVPYGAQLKALRGPLDVLIATPGRLMDHMASGKAILANVEVFVLDEADRMLDMGFIDDITHIASFLPPQRQTVMFSATFAGPVGQLAKNMLKPEAQTIAVATHTSTHVNIEQRLHWA